MADQVTVKGQIVGLEKRDYDFKNAAGEQIAGTTHTIWIGNPDGEPSSIRLTEAQWEQVKEGYGKNVVVVADLLARNNQIRRVAQSVQAG